MPSLVRIRLELRPVAWKVWNINRQTDTVFITILLRLKPSRVVNFQNAAAAKHYHQANADVLRPNADVLRPNANVLLPNADVLQPNADVLWPNADVLRPNTVVICCIVVFNNEMRAGHHANPLYSCPIASNNFNKCKTALFTWKTWFTANGREKRLFLQLWHEIYAFLIFT